MVPETGASGHSNATSSYFSIEGIPLSFVSQLNEEESLPVVIAQSVKSSSPTSKPRRRRRKPWELGEHEKWYCPRGCGKFYRRTSNKYILEFDIICSRNKYQKFQILIIAFGFS